MAVTDSERLARIERRQEALIQAVNRNTGTVEITHAVVTEMMEWLKTPPSHELSDTLKALVAMTTEQRDAIVRLCNDVARVLARVT